MDEFILCIQEGIKGLHNNGICLWKECIALERAF